MRTHSPAQVATRSMTDAQKQAQLAERIAADHVINEAHLAQFRATVALCQVAYRANLSPAELHGLDMQLARGADPVALLESITISTPQGETP